MEKKTYGFIVEPSLFVEDRDKKEDILIPDSKDIDCDLSLPEVLPVFPMSRTVLFPGVVFPVNIGRSQPRKFIDEIYKNRQFVAVLTQKRNFWDRTMSIDDLYKIGTVAQIVKILEMPDDSRVLILQGKKRFCMEKVLVRQSVAYVTYRLFTDDIPQAKSPEYEATVSMCKDLLVRIVNLSSQFPAETVFVIQNIDHPYVAAGFLSCHAPAGIHQKQMILETPDMKDQASALLDILTRELQVLEIKYQIESRVKSDFDKQQREMMLRHQMRKIQEELGNEPTDLEFKNLENAARKKKWSKEHRKIFDRKMEKLQRLNLTSVEYSNQLNYLYTVLDIPWNQYTKDHFDLVQAARILDEEHFGLEKVKERLLEYLAVLQLKKDMKSPILCFTGPPGVGKTSLGRSIAKALNRKYVRMSLGGLSDEAEIRGHRKTYIGAMPGRILQNIRKVGSANPVFVLDEIDKMGAGVHGDTASALLEVLDPEQNNAFYDNYLEMDFDLSQVLFIATANTLTSISPALRDRMEIIEVNGYVQEEKIAIAQKYLIPKQISEHGLKADQAVFPTDTIACIIDHYTRESGVRELDKAIASVVRHLAKKIVMKEDFFQELHPENIGEILGAPKYLYDQCAESDAGLATALAWTAEGGDIMFVESSLSQGDGTLTLTGNLGAVMKESAVIALEYIRAHHASLQLPAQIFGKQNVHIHVPDGAIPKDGPSAGLAMVVAMVSAFTHRKVRGKTAMTGEITLHGKVLPVGGIKEKILAAKRAGITDIFLSTANCKDVEEIKTLYLKGLNLSYTDDIADVLQQVLE
ncbi:MAG: endopeptidase La [Bacteroidales bacterium]|jgi:ATP-dependent Lon protease|nr:endopeptidase La [Bacteroidales bacterium]